MEGSCYFAWNVEMMVYRWQEARRDGIFAGLTSGLAGALVGSKSMGFGRNKTIISGACESRIIAHTKS
ncbi:uncharacterized protein F5891DRAFT_28586 [Suillus fuscotomentosus]|uniref:Uncharacterized protein n=1 Tax=Suillus fuscotomentosus TaxID=1912939 RepID=A0AAD4EMH9_9AGAM|nr:uncharacterized protein F5891DRAFT_28586 [Suillus fuscotomentosus]KAG1908822.1 hypothetical protein F5891DRAFT_28586 [Suillus fuscotomentosus]